MTPKPAEFQSSPFVTKAGDLDHAVAGVRWHGGAIWMLSAEG